MACFMSTFLLFSAAALALSAAFSLPSNPSPALKLSSRTLDKNGAAPRATVTDKRIQAFVESYLGTLKVCDVDKVTDNFAVGYVAFDSKGDAVGVARQRVGIASFCAVFKGTTFSLLEAKQVAPNVVFIRVEARNDDALPDGPVMYSQALSLSRSPDGLKIQSEVTSASPGAFKAAMGGGGGSTNEAA